MKVYLGGSLRNPTVLLVATQLRAAGLEVFDDWYASGPEADDKWRDYEIQRGHTFPEALDGHTARHVFEFDRTHIRASNAFVLLMPAGKSSHIELGYAQGIGLPTYVLFDKFPERFDVMYRFADGVTDNVQELIRWLTA